MKTEIVLLDNGARVVRETGTERARQHGGEFWYALTKADWEILRK